VKALTLDALLKVLWKGIVEEAGFLAMLLKNQPEKKELLPIDFSGLSGYYLDNGSGG
jgi:glutathionylspermidine synthase